MAEIVQSSNNEEGQHPSKSGSPWIKWFVVALVVGGLAALSYFVDVRGALETGIRRIDDLGYAGMAVFIAMYIAACVLFLPGSVLTLGAGAVYGLVQGTILVSVASTLGATAAFLVGRYVARGWVSSKIAGNARFAAIDDAVAKEGWKIVGLTRLSPAFPFTLLNYAYGLTRVSLRDYFLASWIGMLPGTIMYVYIGTLGQLATSEGQSAGQIALKIVGLVATVAVTVYVTRLARTALRRHVDDGALGE